MGHGGILATNGFLLVVAGEGWILVAADGFVLVAGDEGGVVARWFAVRLQRSGR